jgi:arylsulfatase A-like enzyme
MVISVALFWVGMEWLFFVTKPSFMTVYPWWGKIGLIPETAAIVSVSLLLTSLPFYFLGRLLDGGEKPRTAAGVVTVLPAALLLSAALLLLIDNFTLTLFGWGMRSVQGEVVWLYRVLFAIMLSFSAGKLQRLLTRPAFGSVPRHVVHGAAVVVAIGIVLITVATLRLPVAGFDPLPTGKALPNILILSGDGLSDKHLSAYGYERSTTPFLQTIASEFLIAENNFANASDSGGSIVSRLSGKLPTTTRVIYPPDVLRGVDSYQHLPGILKRLGYYNGDIGMRPYADPYGSNMRNGFDEANLRKLNQGGGEFLELMGNIPGLDLAELFARRMSERLSERVLRIATGAPMIDPLAAVDNPEKRHIRDRDRMAGIRRFIAENRRPFFLHVHMMGTHGYRFKPSRHVFSTAQSSLKKWSLDAYDDSILDFDHYVQETYELLKSSGLLDTTIFVITSDHGFHHNVLERVPLMLRLPRSGRTGTVEGNTEQIDIAPTLLEAIGVNAPGWMEGRSLLSSSDEALGARSIFASSHRLAKSVEGNSRPLSNQNPPWYSLGRLYLIKCDQAFVLKTQDLVVHERKDFEGSALGCRQHLTVAQARQIMFARLAKDGYLPAGGRAR